MKNLFRISGIVVMAAMMALVLGACGGEDEAKTVTVALPQTSGEFTLTDIPSKYNGKFVLLHGRVRTTSGANMEEPGLNMFGMLGGRATLFQGDLQDFTSYTCVPIENGTVKMPLYMSSSPFVLARDVEAYAGNHSARVWIYIFDKQIVSHEEWQTDKTYTAYAIFATTSTFPVQFSSGKASKSNNEANTKLSN